MLKVLSGCMVTSVSRKGIEPCCVGSTVNWMWGSWLFMCWSRSWLCSALLMTNVLSTNLSQREGGLGKVWRTLTSNSSMKMLAMRWLMGDPIAAPCIVFIILTLEEEVSVGEAELQQGDDLGSGHRGPFVAGWCPVVACV